MFTRVITEFTCIVLKGHESITTGHKRINTYLRCFGDWTRHSWMRSHLVCCFPQFLPTAFPSVAVCRLSSGRI